MDSAVAGLRAHQSKLDVIGNNIANVNTFWIQGPDLYL
ncbi:MAG: flagellar basal body protein [Enterocloster bolteae]